jgi:pimeloyl-ACP methyl ester carboxylesterase
MAIQPDNEVRSVRASDGARLDYEVAGQGPALVMLHGFLAGRRAFSRQQVVLTERFRLIMPSARGHDGGHDGCAASIPAAYGAGTSDVDDLNAVLAAEHIGEFRLLGHSSGGATAFAFARLHPDRVTRLIMIEPTLYRLLDPAAFDAEMAPVEAIIATAANDGPVAALRKTMDTLGGDAWASMEEARKAERLRALASCAPFVGPHFRGLLDFPVTAADVTALRPPALLLYGAASFPFEAAIAARFRASRPDLQVITIDGAGHNVHRDRADTVNQVVTAFLA